MVPHNSINKFFNCYLAFLLNVMFFFFLESLNVVLMAIFQNILQAHTKQIPIYVPIISIHLYILRGFKKLVIAFFPIKNTPKLINQQLKNGVKIVDWQKKVSYCLFYCQKYLYLKLKNLVKIVN